MEIARFENPVLFLECIVAHLAADKGNAVVVEKKVLAFFVVEQRIDNSAVDRIFPQVSPDILFEQGIAEFFHQPKNFGYGYPSENDALVVEVFLYGFSRQGNLGVDRLTSIDEIEYIRMIKVYELDLRLFFKMIIDIGFAFGSPGQAVVQHDKGDIRNSPVQNQGSDFIYFFSGLFVQFDMGGRIENGSIICFAMSIILNILQKTA